MTNLDRLLAEYIAEHRAGGEADPLVYLDRAPDDQRIELAERIDAYLARAPRRAFDVAAFAASDAERTAEEIERALAGDSGLWPAILPGLRHRAGLRRGELISRLAGALGVPDRADRVAGYYHQMEHGLLPSRGVSDRVLEALGAIVGESAAMLRDAGAALHSAPGELPPAGAVFARTATSDTPEAAAGAARPVPPADEWDEVDELFRGG